MPDLPRRPLCGPPGDNTLPRSGLASNTFATRLSAGCETRFFPAQAQEDIAALCRRWGSQPRTAAPAGRGRRAAAWSDQSAGQARQPHGSPGEAIDGATRLLPAGALAVAASRPAAGPALAFLQLLLGPPDTALSGGLLLGILDPADELVAGQGRDVLPGIECRPVGDQCLTQVRGQFMHHPPGHSLAAHWPIVVSRGQARSRSAATFFRPTVPTRGTCVPGPAGLRRRAGPTRSARQRASPSRPTLLLRRRTGCVGATVALIRPTLGAEASGDLPSRRLPAAQSGGGHGRFESEREAGRGRDRRLSA